MLITVCHPQPKGVQLLDLSFPHIIFTSQWLTILRINLMVSILSKNGQFASPEAFSLHQVSGSCPKHHSCPFTNLLPPSEPLTYICIKNGVMAPADDGQVRGGWQSWRCCTMVKTIRMNYNKTFVSKPMSFITTQN